MFHVFFSLSSFKIAQKKKIETIIRYFENISNYYYSNCQNDESEKKK